MVNVLLLFVSAVAVLLQTVSSAPSASRDSAKAYALKSTHAAPEAWIETGAAPLDQVISLQIGLRQSRIDELLKHLNEGMQLSSLSC
jgi:hypothetical protein